MGLREFLLSQFNFGEINQMLNCGIYETELFGDTDVSFGCSYELIDGEFVYIYNIFVGGEYINISNHGTPYCILPDAVIYEMTIQLSQLGYC